MTVRINHLLCNGCGISSEPACVKVCPVDLLYKDTSSRCFLRDSRDCWDCAACVKECPRQAIEMYLPAQIGGRGATLKAKSRRNLIEWQLTHPDGKEELFKIVTSTNGGNKNVD